MILGIFLSLQNPPDTAIKKTMRERLFELDYVGPIIFIPASVCLLLALQWGSYKLPWNSPQIICLFACFGILTMIWIYSQRRLGEKATIPIRLLVQRTVFYSSLFSFFASAGNVIPTYYIPLYFQAIKSSSPTLSAIYTLPLILSVIVSSVIAGGLVTKVGYYTPFMVVGSGLLAIGTGLLSILRVGTSVPEWIGFQVIAGAGTGMFLQVSNSKRERLTTRCQFSRFKPLCRCKICQWLWPYSYFSNNLDQPFFSRLLKPFC